VFSFGSLKLVFESLFLLLLLLLLVMVVVVLLYNMSNMIPSVSSSLPLQ
jgi:hypothetical protein